MLRISIVVSVIIFSQPGLTSEEALDEEFLLWLGQIAELEEIGMDINQLIAQENKNSESDDQEQSND